MKKNITCLTDYKGNFLSKWLDDPYRSGMDKDLMVKYFNEHNIKIQFRKFSELKFKESEIKGNLFLYTSSEDFGSHYKYFIEDVVLGIEESGGKVIPSYKFLKAHNNKVFMEILCGKLGLRESNHIETKYFGTLEEVYDVSENLDYPVIFKSAFGSSGSTVELVNNRRELETVIKKHCRTWYTKYYLRDFIRGFKRKGYIRESLYRNKFIIQNFIPNLKNDWKVYVFFDKYFIFYRPIFEKRIFKASGGGYGNYFYGANARIPSGIFNFAEKVYKNLNVPNVSLDIGYDGNSFMLFEFQCLHFGTAGIVYSNEYFTKKNGNWVHEVNSKIIEKEYVESIVKYLDASNLLS